MWLVCCLTIFSVQFHSWALAVDCEATEIKPTRKYGKFAVQIYSPSAKGLIALTNNTSSPVKIVYWEDRLGTNDMNLVREFDSDFCEGSILIYAYDRPGYYLTLDENGEDLTLTQNASHACWQTTNPRVDPVSYYVNRTGSTPRYLTIRGGVALGRGPHPRRQTFSECRAKLIDGVPHAPNICWWGKRESDSESSGNGPK